MRETTITYNGVDLSEHVNTVNAKSIDGLKEWSIKLDGVYDPPAIDVQLSELTEDEELLFLKAIGDEIWRRIVDRRQKAQP